jgi:hypothetical protein
MTPIATLKPAEIKRRRGGARPGAGRKPSELTVAFRDYFADDVDDLFGALRDLALGHRRADREGRVYSVPPDQRALMYVLDRLLGKAREEGEAAPDLSALLTALRGERTSATA